MSWFSTERAILGLLVCGVMGGAPGAALGQDRSTTPGYPERVVQWTVEAGESCADVAKAMYGDARRVDLVQRYNGVACTAGAPLEQGITLVLPAEATKLPSARLTMVNPETRARPSAAAAPPSRRA